MITDICHWLSKCTVKPMDDIAEEEILEAFLEVQLLKKSKQPEAARMVLAQLQVTIENQLQYHYQ